MKKHKRLTKNIIVILALAVGFTFAVPAYSFGTTTEPTLVADAALLIDMTTGRVLYEKNADKREFPASTTKIMTCLLALENLDMMGRITADEEAAATGGNSMNLKADEWINTGIMVSAMMVISGNDAAVAVAKEISGSVADFAELMNKRAKELGMTDTHFVNPHGLHDEEHYTTARDLATLAQYCMQNEVFRRIVSRAEFTVPVTNITLAERHYYNTNLLLNDTNPNTRVYVNGELRDCKYDGCIGIKTGYTNAAGGCLVAAAERDGTTLLSVVLKSGSMERFSDSITLLDWGFENYKTETILETGWLAGSVKVKHGKEGSVDAILPVDAIITLPSESSKEVITTQTELYDKVEAPVMTGDKVGTLKLLRVDKVMAEYDLVAGSDVEKGTGNWVFTMLKIIGVIILVLVLIVAIWIIQERRAAKKRRAAREERRKQREAEEIIKREEWEKNYKNRYR